MAHTELVIITGLSGAGKSTAVRCFEEMGYFTVDNMPPALLPTFVTLCTERATPVEHVAAVVDIRGGQFFDAVSQALDDLDQGGVRYRILFLGSQTDVLVSRFKEHRFPHPLHAQCDSLLSCIETEREILSELKARASVVLDTSVETVRQLRGEVMRLFPLEPESDQRTVFLTSFGFKYGIPADLDFLFDVRFLANPHYEAELRPLTGEDARVQAYVDADPRTATLEEHLGRLLDFVLPELWAEGRRYVSLGIGCTGGKHRSVVLALKLAERCRERGYRTVVQQRDML
ncbi:MAG: RNase adapter RapZ, partial [Armatimonadetes bacterium]|nr:RNase adapter RapZ [Armatimonadota bacterium]